MLSKIRRYISSSIAREDFLPTWKGIFINPFYLDRKYIGDAIKKYGKQLRGRVLDFGCGTSPYKALLDPTAEYLGLEHDSMRGNPHKQASLYYDGRSIPLQDKSIDAVLSTQSLEHVDNAEVIIAEWARVLRPGGKLLLTVPLMWPEHESPYDFQRYTTHGIRAVLQKHQFSIEAQEKLLSGYPALVQLLMAWLYDVFLVKLSSRWRLLTTCFFAFFLVLPAVIIDKVKSGDSLTYLGTCTLATKK